MPSLEVNFDAMVGPTHHYAGLGAGNLASQKYKGTIANPRRAALEGLEKMKLLADMGIPQAVLPPQLRPDMTALRRLGFTGDDSAVLAAAARENLPLLSQYSSASSMWAANAATVSPSSDTADGRLHLTIANLISQPHRALEAAGTLALFRQIFNDESHFAVNAPVEAPDEGAANHTRLCVSYDGPGVEVFTFGRDVNEPESATRRFRPRQSLQASRKIASMHGLDHRRTLFVQQTPQAIDAGVFHNDVICVGNQNVLLYHELAFSPEDQARIADAYEALTGQPVCALNITSQELPIETAIETYLFNSQLLTLPTGGMLLLAPAECKRNPAARSVIARLLAEDNPIASARFIDVRQSMQNGGGPACLRLRVVMSDAQRRAVRPGIFLTDSLYSRLHDCIIRHYPEHLTLNELADPQLLTKSKYICSELHSVLGLD